MTPPSFVSFQSLFLLTFSGIATVTFSKPPMIVTKLIHPESVFSPFYHPNYTIEDRAQRLLDSSKARAAYLRYRMNKLDPLFERPKTRIIPDGYGFLVNVSIGNPPIPQLLLIDTGSPLTWVQCAICPACDKPEGPVYDHRLSSTYNQLKCGTDNSCHVPESTCTSTLCRYNITYADGSESSGFLGNEQLTFKFDDEDSVVMPGIILGCADEVFDDTFGPVHGLLGLSLGEESIINNLTRFGYCIGDATDPSLSNNLLLLGGDLKLMEGAWTPYTKQYGFYFITLDSISVGDRNITMDPRSFIEGLIIDSGTTVTKLPSDVYYNVRDLVSTSLSTSFPPLHPLPYEKHEWELCYEGKLEILHNVMPIITFQFYKGAVLDVFHMGSFFQTEPNKICLAIEPADDDISVIGIMAQQYHHIVYEIEKQRIYFEPVACEELLSNN